MRVRLILSFALIVLVAVATVVIIALQGAASEVRSFMGTGMQRLDTLAEDLEAYYQQNGSWEGAQALLDGMPGMEGMPMSGRGAGQGAGQGSGQGMMGSGGMMSQGLAIADASGRVLVTSGDPALDSVLTGDQLSFAVPLKDGFKVVGYLYSAYATRFSAGEEQFLVQRLSRAALVGGLAAGVLALVLALVLTYRLLRPISELRLAAHRLSKGDLSQRVPVRGHDELAELANTFNHMAGSLQKAQESRRAMTADIAHELRTPLAVQRASLEALQDGIYPPTPENITSLLEQNQLLNRLVEDLRTLALADAGQLVLEPGPVNLGFLLERIVSRFQAQAKAHQVSIEIDSAPACPEISGDAARLEQILGNLLSNALRYTPSGGRIVLRLSCSPSQVQVAVRDSGPGIPPESLPFIFERFYRAGKSRSRSEGGSGLGLAIARQLAEAHHGTLEAVNDPEGGAIFTLTLPAR